MSKRVLCLAVAIFAISHPASAILVGQIDTFQSGTTEGWGSGPLNPNPPIVVPDVGPAGVGDFALQVTSTGGFGPGSNFVTFNTTQWSGDYLSAGVSVISVDVNNVGATSLDLRLAFDGAGGRFASTVSTSVAAGGGWQTVLLQITAPHLTSTGGFDVNASLSSLTQLRLLSSTVPSFMGDPIVGQALFDNILALAPAVCNNGIDEDVDGRFDAPEDSGCFDATSNTENPACNDGDHNDADGKIDFDGGFEASDGAMLCIGPGNPLDCCTGPTAGCAGPADPQCIGKPFRKKEKKCGLGFELALVLLPLLWLHKQRRA